MSVPAKLTFAASVVATGTIISYVHIKHYRDRENVHQGVLRDIELQEMRKRQNVKMLEDQQELTKILTEQRDGDIKDKTVKTESDPKR